MDAVRAVGEGRDVAVGDFMQLGGFRGQILADWLASRDGLAVAPLAADAIGIRLPAAGGDTALGWGARPTPIEGNGQAEDEGRDDVPADDPGHADRVAAALEELKPTFDPMRRTAWLPKVEIDETLEPVSKYFGVPWMGEADAWPEVMGSHPVFVLQLDVASLPGDIPALLGGSGLVQFFYAEEGEWPADGDLTKLSHVRLVQPDGKPGRRIELAATRSPDECVPRRIVGWTPVDDMPRDVEDELYGIDLDTVAEEHDVYLDDLQPTCWQGDKLGGHPFWTQGPEAPLDDAGEEMLPFYQIDAGCFFEGDHGEAHAPALFAGDGTGHLFVSRTDPTQLKFAWACG